MFDEESRLTRPHQSTDAVEPIVNTRRSSFPGEDVTRSPCVGCLGDGMGGIGKGS